MTIITLEPWEYVHACNVGIARFAANWGKQDAPHYKKELMEDDRTATVAAAICELAVAKAINEYWSASIWKGADHAKYKDLADVGTNIEVRRVRTQDGPAVREKDLKKEGLIIFGVIPAPKEFREVEILGWIPAAEGWEKGTQMQYGRMIHKDLLNPVENWKRQ